jgi:hypothetical protein
MRVAAIEKELLAERAERAARPETKTPTCISCGRGFTYRGPQGDDSGRFCHARCREWFDAGNPAHELAAEERVNRVPLRAWKIVAGPPGVAIGAAYYPPILDRAKKVKRIGKLANDELIRPRRLCERCGEPLPVWVKGKKVSASRKYCAGCAR